MKRLKFKIWRFCMFRCGDCPDWQLDGWGRLTDWMEVRGWDCGHTAVMHKVVRACIPDDL